VCEKNTPLPPKHGWREELEKGGPPTLHYDGGDDYELQKVAENPSAYILILEGHHDHPDCNGTYEYDGDENGKPKWTKGGIKLFWTGGSWDVCFGGFSPEAQVDTPVPPKSGYEKDRGNCDIKVSYEKSLVSSVIKVTGSGSDEYD